MRSAHATRNVDFKTRDLRMWISMISAGMISSQKVMVKSRQVLHPFLTLEQTLEREQMVKSGKEGECCWPVCSQVQANKRSAGLKKLNREHDGVDKVWVLLALIKSKHY